MCVVASGSLLTEVSFSSQILVDVRRVQKDINSVSETSKRSFAVCDEVVFQVITTRQAPLELHVHL